MSTPLVSLIITAYNYEHFVARSIESCLGQRDFDGFETILINDGSQDGTLAVAERYANRVRILSTANNGVEKASNLGFAAARGRFVVRLDADDLLHPDYLAGLASLLQAPADDWAFLYPDYESIDVDDQVLKRHRLPAFDPEEIRRRGDFLATGTLYRKTIIDRFGGYDESVRNCGLENYEFILRLLAAGEKGRHVASPLFGYRIHGSSMSISRRNAIIAYGVQLAARFGLPAYQTNEHHPQGLQL